MKKFLLDKIGARGLIQMLQAFIYASICVVVHTVIFPDLAGVLPIVVLIGIISMQPTYGITRKVIPQIALAFTLECFCHYKHLFFPNQCVYLLCCHDSCYFGGEFLDAAEIYGNDTRDWDSTLLSWNR